jgi:murein DD-endopeptidase MepM/ murein hydrolase activator NlpD
MVNPDDSTTGFSLNGLDEKDFDALPKEMLKVFKEVEKLVDKIAKDWGKTLEETKDTAKEIGDSSGGVGGKMSKSLGKFSTPAGKVGMGVMAIGAAYMSMAPNTMDAVTQRMAADTFAGLSGVKGGSRGAIRDANRMVGGGATSAMGPTMAQATLFSGGGMAAGTVGAKNIMSQMSGMSAFSGMSNEQAASSVSGVNGMQFLRMGIRVRDNNGEIRKTSALINEVYQFMFRGQKLTKAEAAMVYAPRSKSNVLLQQISEGDPDLFQFLASGIVARASAGSDKKFTGAMNSKDPNKMLDLMGVDKSSPLRSNFKFNTSEANKLLATEKGLNSGYNASLNAASSLNDGYSKMAATLGPVNDGLMNLKAILQTFPNAGGVAGGVSQIAGAGMNAAMTAAMLRGGKVPAVAGTTVAGKFGSVAGKFGTAGKAVPVLGAALSAYGGYQAAKSKGGFDWGSLLTSTAMGAGTGALMGAGTGPGAAVTALIGGLIGGGSNLLGQMFGRGGERGDTMNLGTGADKTAGSPSPAASPVPSGTPTTSPFGLRPGAVKRAAAHGQKISLNHQGVDYGVPSGTAIKAVADGIVEKTGNDPTGWGNYVLIRHPDGTSSRYCHLRRINVSRNQKIKKGTVIGLSGGGAKDPGRGNSTAAHLHLEIANKAGVRVDPESWLANARIPILPGYNDTGKRSQVGSMLFDKYSSLDDIFSPNSLDNFLKNSADFGGVSYSDIKKQYSKQELSAFASIADSYTGKPTSNKKDLIRMIAAGGFHGAALKTAYAISIAESGGRSNAKGDISLQDAKWGPSVGLFQIRSLKNWKKYNDPYRDASKLQDPSYNIEAAWSKSKQGTNFKPWSTYTGGSFIKHLSEADAMAKAAGVGGGSESMNVGTAGGNVATMSRPSTVGGTVTANSNVTINLDMRVSIASSGPAEAERLVRMVGEKLQKDANLKRIASSL